MERGDAVTGLRCCDEALALAPLPWDLAMTRAVRGFGRIKAGDLDGGMAELQEALDWLGRSQLRYQRARFALWLAEGHLRGGEPSRARAISQEVSEFEFHISPVCNSSRPQTGRGTRGTSSSSRRTRSGSVVRRCGLSTASATSGMTPSCQRRIS